MAAADPRGQDRPDLIESELSGLAFDSNQQIFKTAHIDLMFEQRPPMPELNEPVFTFIDPAAGGPQSDYAVLSVTRQKGLLTVRLTPASGAQIGRAPEGPADGEANPGVRSTNRPRARRAC